MHYEDQARRFNLLSGFLFGALIGTGVGVLLGPVDGVRIPRRRRSRRERLAGEWKRVRAEAKRGGAELASRFSAG